MKRMALVGLVSALFPVLLFAEATPSAKPAAATSEAAFDAGIMGVGFNTTNLERSVQFYTKGLGMTVIATMGPAEHRETFLGFDRDPNKPRFILFSGTVAATATPDFGRVIFKVSDVAVIQARLKNAGYEVKEINKAPSGHQVLQVVDPDGYKLEFVASPK